MQTSRLCAAALLMAAGLIATWRMPVSSAETKFSVAAPQSITLTGSVICIPEELHKRHGTELATSHAHIFGFRAHDGMIYTLLRGKMAEPLFLDPRLKDKTLVLRGRIFPRSQVLEVTGNLRSVKEGQLLELYYYCEICAIKTVSPEVCPCCQEDVELRESPPD